MGLITSRTLGRLGMRLLLVLCFALTIVRSSFAAEEDSSQPTLRPNLGWLTFAQIVAQPVTNGQAITVAQGTVASPGLKFAGSNVGFYINSGTSLCLTLDNSSCGFMFYLTAGLNISASGQISFSAGAADGAGTATIKRVSNDTLVLGPQSLAPSKNFVPSDTSTNSTSFVSVTGLTWNTNLAIGSTPSATQHFDCYGQYSIATAVVAVDFGIQITNNAPTNAMVTGMQWTNTGAVAPVAGVVTALNTTTATSVTSATPNAINTNYPFELHGFIEHPGNAAQAVTQIMFKTAAGADSVTVKRGSYCTVF